MNDKEVGKLGRQDRLCIKKALPLE